jgi:hypothetical protein
MIAKLNFTPSRSVLVAPELKLEIISAERLIFIPLRLATSASKRISTIKVGTIKNRDVM